jgi:hypothetical protein
METSFKLHDPDSSYLGKELPVTNVCEAEWDSLPVMTLYKREISLTPAGHPTPDF